jgi:hypothetical protein
MLSDERQKRVVIVDTSNEIGGDGDVPHPAIGSARRMQAGRQTDRHAPSHRRKRVLAFMGSHADACVTDAQLVL